MLKRLYFFSFVHGAVQTLGQADHVPVLVLLRLVDSLGRIARQLRLLREIPASAVQIYLVNLHSRRSRFPVKPS